MIVPVPLPKVKILLRELSVNWLAGGVAAGALAAGLDSGLESAVPSGLHAAAPTNSVRVDTCPK
jgi:hypothetical protein